MPLRWWRRFQNRVHPITRHPNARWYLAFPNVYCEAFPVRVVPTLASERWAPESNNAEIEFGLANIHEKRSAARRSQSQVTAGLAVEHFSKRVRLDHAGNGIHLDVPHPPVSVTSRFCQTAAFLRRSATAPKEKQGGKFAPTRISRSREFQPQNSSLIPINVQNTFRGLHWIRPPRPGKRLASESRLAVPM